MIMLHAWKRFRFRPAVVFLLPFLLVASALAGEIDPAQDVYDHASVLTKEEKAEFTEKARAMRDQFGMSFGILFVDGIGGKDPMEYTDDFYDQNLLGFGPEYHGMLLMVDLGGRNIWISTHGKAIGMFSDKTLDGIIAVVGHSLKKGEYAGACRLFLNMTNSHCRSNRELTRGEILGYGSLLGLIVGIFAGGVVAGVQLVRHWLARGRQAAAECYMPAGSSNIADLGTNFIRSYVTSTPITRSSSRSRGSSGGGSSTHRSSGGRTHGGRGGRF